MSSLAQANPIVARYETDAAAYGRYWAPVLEETSLRLLDFVAPFVARQHGLLRILEVGVGTGTLLLAALARWPGASIIATDAAGAMLWAARERALSTGLAEDGERLKFVVGAADRLPLPAGSVDLVISSFVVQLVPDRHAALREANRLLRPGGMAAFVTWLDRDAREPFVPMIEFDEAVLDLEVDEPETADEPRAGDIRSARSATNELRRAGFRRASAREDMLVYDWSPESYLEYKLAYDESALLGVLDARQQRELEGNARRRFARLAPSDFRWRAPVVFARALTPAP